MNDNLYKITESESLYHHLEQLSPEEILIGINMEDQKVALVVEKCIPTIAGFIEDLLPRMKQGGRLFYLGAGTSGRLGILDASECPPTFGVSPDRVVGLIAGGDAAIRKAQEYAEDDENAGWLELLKYNINSSDTVVGIAASGTTPYVVGTLRKVQAAGILTACITCNPMAPIIEVASHPLVAVVGPEFITGSTRMKAGTAQKLILNMISTTVMISLGHVKGNKMVDMQLTNEKLIIRGTRMIIDATGWPEEKARETLMAMGSVRAVLDSI